MKKMKNRTKTIIWAIVTAILTAVVIWFMANIGRVDDMRPIFWGGLFLIGWDGMFLTWFIANRIWKHWNE